MARVYAQVHHDMWKPGDFREVSPLSKLLYIALMSQPGITSAGVLALNPSKLAVITGMTAKEVAKCLEELEAGRFIAMDDEESEVLVRTFIKWDRPNASPTGLKGLIKAIQTVSSVKIKSVLKDECDRLGVAWEFTKRDGEVVHLECPFDDLIDAPSMPLRSALEVVSNGASKPHGSGSGSGLGSGSVSREPKPDRFDEFWAAYPKKADKPKAKTAWLAALKRASADEIIAGAERYRDDPNRSDKFTKYPQGWLSGDRWNDGPVAADPPPRDSYGGPMYGVGF